MYLLNSSVSGQLSLWFGRYVSCISVIRLCRDVSVVSCVINVRAQLLVPLTSSPPWPLSTSCWSPVFPGSLLMSRRIGPMLKFRVDFKFEIMVWTVDDHVTKVLWLVMWPRSYSFIPLSIAATTVKYLCVFVVVTCGTSKISCYIWWGNWLFRNSPQK